MADDFDVYQLGDIRVRVPKGVTVEHITLDRTVLSREVEERLACAGELRIPRSIVGPDRFWTDALLDMFDPAMKPKIVIDEDR